MRKAKISLSVAAVGALVATGLATTAPADASPQRRAVARTAPTWVGRTHSLGAAPTTADSTFRVYLQPRGGMDALKAAVSSVSNPKSPSYRHFLSASSYHAKYDATSASVRQVSAFLRENHLTVGSVEAHHRYISASGTNAAVQRAFAVKMRTYHRSGQTVQANDRAVSVPTSVASQILTVTGLDTSRHLLKHQATAASPAVAPGPGFRNARPCSKSYGQVAATYQADYKTKLPQYNGKTLPYAVCGYTGPQYRAAYTGNSPLTGAGTTVAVIDAYASPTIAKDASTYARNNGDAKYASGQLSQVVPSKFTFETECDAAGWYGEETLDVEAVHAMAGASKIRYYGAQSCQDSDFLTTQTKVVDENKASIVTNSYGEADQYLTSESINAEEQVFLQGALQGITWLFSSGDDGDEVANTGLKQTDSSASDPYVTAVGGTADAIGADGTFEFQTGWGTKKSTLGPKGDKWVPNGYLYGAGGGVSSLFNQPSYQQDKVPAKFSGGRAVPDIAMDADPTTGMLVGQTQTFSIGVKYGEYRIGGTSLASPLMAGMTALASQHAGGRLGFLNPTIYGQNGKVISDVRGAPADAGNVRVDYLNGENDADGLNYTVRTFNQDASLYTSPGWDNVTGLGSPKAAWLTSLK